MSDLLVNQALTVRAVRVGGAELDNELYLDNDYTAEAEVRTRNARTGTLEPASGLTVTIRLSAAQDGQPINGALQLSAAERPAKSGRYYAVFDGQTLRDWLAPAFVDATVYAVYSSP